MSLALQVLITGVAAGGVYGLLAAGHSLLYRLTGVVHFALGDLVGLGVFTTLFAAAGTGPVTQATANGPRFVGALMVGLVVCVGAGIGSYLFVVHPYLVRGSIVGSVAAIVAVAFAVRAILAAIFDRPAYVFPDVVPFRRIGREGFVEIGGASIQARAFFVIAVAIGLALFAAWVLEGTRFGRALRAVASDPEGAATRAHAVLGPPDSGAGDVPAVAWIALGALGAAGLAVLWAHS